MNARDFALIELDAKALPLWPARLVRGRSSDHGPPADPRDLALAEQLITGVVKNLRPLRYLIHHYSGRSLLGIDPLVQKILAIGLYQVRFLDRIPAHAAVDEAVEQAKRFGHGKAAGFVNAVLRRATREGPPATPDRGRNPQGYAEMVLSHPPELFRRLVGLLGVADALRFCEHDHAEPPTIVRLFRGGSAGQLAKAGVVVRPHEQAGMFVVEGAKRSTLAEWAEGGIAQVQDPTAAMVAEQCDVHSGQRVLDRCAGLGTKTLQLHQRLEGSGVVVAVDASEERCGRLRELIRLRGLTGIAVHHASMLGQIKDALPESFDRVLVDAPCSNSGVLARRPEAIYSQTDKQLKSLERLQSEILHDTARWVAPGGLLVYGTCSIWPEENGDRVAEFLSVRADYEKVRDQTTWPSLEDEPTRYRDGGYFAVLRRR